MNSALGTFAFVDIAGFGAYTRERGDEAAARLAVSLDDRVRSLLPAGAEVVKTLGDGVMIRADDAVAAVGLGSRLARESRDGLLPPLRVGIETGPAIGVERDWFGATVNRAARLCDAAKPGEVLVTEAVRELASGDGVAFRRRRAKRIRDLECRERVYAAVEPARATGLARLWRRIAAAARAYEAAVCPKHRAAAREVA